MAKQTSMFPAMATAITMICTVIIMAVNAVEKYWGAVIGEESVPLAAFAVGVSFVFILLCCARPILGCPLRCCILSKLFGLVHFSNTVLLELSESYWLILKCSVFMIVQFGSDPFDRIRNATTRNYHFVASLDWNATLLCKIQFLRIQVGKVILWFQVKSRLIKAFLSDVPFTFKLLACVLSRNIFKGQELRPSTAGEFFRCQSLPACKSLSQSTKGFLRLDNMNLIPNSPLFSHRDRDETAALLYWRDAYESIRVQQRDIKCKQRIKDWINIVLITRQSLQVPQFNKVRFLYLTAKMEHSFIELMDWSLPLAKAACRWHSYRSNILFYAVNSVITRWILSKFQLISVFPLWQPAQK